MTGTTQPLAYVTGATGFVGSHVAEVLRDRGWRVRMLVRNPGKVWPELRDPAQFEPVTGSLEDDPAALARGMDGVDTVFHVAGLIGAIRQSDFDRVNVEGTRRMIEAAHLSPTPVRRFLLVSSVAAFGPSDDLGRLRREDDPATPRTMYGKSKLAGERLAWELCAKYAIPLTVVRPPAVYGPRDTAILEFFRYMAKGIEVGLGGPARRMDLIHGRDLARGIVLAAESARAAGEAYQLTDGGDHPFRDVMTLLREVIRPRRKLRLTSPVFVVRVVAKLNDLMQAITGKVRLPNTDKLGELLPLRWSVDGTKAREHFGFAPEIPLRDGLAATAEWYEREGWIRVGR